jgi:hypothetical protein
MRENRSEEAMKHRVEYRKSIGRTTVPPGNLAEQVQYGEPTTDMKMFPTPRANEPGRTTKGYGRGLAELLEGKEQVDPKMWRTPTTMDSKEDSLKHATKLLQGKNLRSTGSRIQITLADEVMAQEIMNNPELMEQYKDYKMMTRKNLPEQQEFVDYMREQTSVKELHEKTGIKKTTVEHWFRRDKAGFSHPSVEDWNAIKIHFKNLKCDNVMTALHSIEWKQEEMKIWRTPDAHCDRGASSKERMKMKLEKGMPISLNDQVAHPNLMWSTPVQDDVHHRKQKYSQGGTALSTQAGGSLNPTWVEWLMGYPGGYTDLKHWEILSSRKSSKKSATPSSKPKKKKT